MKKIYLFIFISCVAIADINAQCTASIQSGMASQTVCLDSAIQYTSYNVGDYTNRYNSVSGLAPGLFFEASNIQCITTPCNQSVIISGKATASGVYPYSLESNKGCPSSGTMGVITVSTSGSCARSCFANYSATYDTVQNQFTLTLDAANNGLTYLWDFGDGGSSTLATPTHTFAKDSTYTVCLRVVTSVNDTCTYCHVIGKNAQGKIFRTTGFTMTVVKSIQTGLQDVVSKENNFTVYPNPTSAGTDILFNSVVNNISIKVYTASGQKILEKVNVSGDRFHLDMADQVAGVYFIEVHSGSTIYRQKLIKQ